MPEIRFTPFGIPYLLEFANVSIRSPSASSRSKSLPKPTKIPKPPARCPTCGHHPHAEKRENNADDDEKVPRPGGLYIQFPSRKHSTVPVKISERSLARLRRTIADAVMQAGMSSPAAAEIQNPMDTLPAAGGEQEEKPKRGQAQALFKGTYGQVKEALRAAGLTTTPCSELGLDHTTRIGALFVTNSKRKDGDGLELTKLTLWG